MLLTLPDFEYVSCRSLADACSCLSGSNGEAKVYAGGTDMLVSMKHRNMLPRTLVNIKCIPGLDYIQLDQDGGLRIGALTTMRSIANSSLVRKEFSALGKAADVLGTPQIRALATLGGNLGNASPAAECAPSLLVFEANAKITSSRGDRVVPIRSFFTGPGKSVLGPDEILTEVQVPGPPAHSRSIHLKYSSRKVDVAVAGVSMLIRLDGRRCEDVRIALNSVGPFPFRAKQAESVLRGEMLGLENHDLIERTARAASEESSPIDDLRGSSAHRRKLVEILVRDAIHYLLSDHAFTK